MPPLPEMGLYGAGELASIGPAEFKFIGSKGIDIGPLTSDVGSKGIDVGPLTSDMGSKGIDIGDEYGS